MNRLTVSLFFLAGVIVFSSACGSQASRDEKKTTDIESAVSDVNALSKRKLGISLTALSMLMVGHSNTKIYLDKSSLGENELIALNELQAHGYVLTRDVTSPQGVMIEMSYTDKGRQLLDCL